MNKLGQLCLLEVMSPVLDLVKHWAKWCARAQKNIESVLEPRTPRIFHGWNIMRAAVPLHSLNKSCFSFLLSFFSFLFSTSFVPFIGVWHYKRQSSTTSNHNQITCLVRLFFFQKRGGLKALIVWNIFMAENWELGIFPMMGMNERSDFPVFKCLPLSSNAMWCYVLGEDRKEIRLFFHFLSKEK